MDTKVGTVTLNESKQFIMDNIIQQQRALRDNKPSSVILISGAPGIGKSDLMTRVAIDLGMGLNPQYLGTMLLEQFGMPLPTTNGSDFQKWSKPDFYSVDNLRVNAQDDTSKEKFLNLDKFLVYPKKDIILFMDDIHLATKTIQTYFFQLLTYRSIHNKKMPNNFIMVAAGNRAVDRAGAQPIMAPIVNRFFILDVRAEADDWLNNFANTYGVRQDIISFIEFYPHLLQSEPLESKPWASPRSWTYFSDALNQLESGYKAETKIPASTLLTLASGHIGMEYASKFIEYVKLFLEWDAAKFFDNTPLPDLTTLSKIQNYTLMSAIVSELMKDLRASNFDVTIPRIKKKLVVTRNLFQALLTSCKEIIPLGLRSILLSDPSKQAVVFYSLVQGNQQLIDAMSKILNLKK